MDKELDSVAVAAGRLAGRVEVLQWAQSEITVELAKMQSEDKFADTRALERFLDRVRDSLMSVQDGTGTWAGLVRTVVEDSDVGGETSTGVPSA